MTVFRAEDVQTATRAAAATMRDRLQIGSVDELRTLMFGILHEELPNIFITPAAPAPQPAAAPAPVPDQQAAPTTT